MEDEVDIIMMAVCSPDTIRMINAQRARSVTGLLNRIPLTAMTPCLLHLSATMRLESRVKSRFDSREMMVI
jgi:hypothetical protein